MYNPNIYKSRFSGEFNLLTDPFRPRHFLRFSPSSRIFRYLSLTQTLFVLVRLSSGRLRDEPKRAWYLVTAMVHFFSEGTSSYSALWVALDFGTWVINELPLLIPLLERPQSINRQGSAGSIRKSILQLTLLRKWTYNGNSLGEIWLMIFCKTIDTHDF